jgi:hypothetical protein
MKKIIPFLAALTLLLQACGGNQPDTGAVEAAATEAANEAPTAEPIVHTVIPQGGLKARAYAHDHEESATSEKKNVTAGDDFRKNQFERPFTSNEMAYLPDLDIVDFGITSDDQFFYISIILSGVDATSGSLTGVYGVEVDRDFDGRAELMLGVQPPYSTEFTAENVVVLADLDGDIGGPTSTRPDQGFEGNGYDGIIFDLSQSIHPDDPDLAWVRFVEGDRPTIEIAYRKWIFRGGDEQFMWNVFAFSADQGLDPAKFNIHDSISDVEAGSPNKGDANYPVKALAAMDNTCRVPMGFDATGFEPLGCLVKGPEIVVEDEGGDGNNGENDFCSRFPEICKRGIPVPRPPRFIIGPPTDGASNTIILQ